jgi:hypothetical protein
MPTFFIFYYLFRYTVFCEQDEFYADEIKFNGAISSEQIHSRYMYMISQMLPCQN